ncbi:hypothetical protein PPACK8108_LOCUS21626 [Phakopsora pachyrhizi]|uniref:BTB domain-containing protein n=1 Tax=Phakopsora pachyrhizi TaxID=170000 RepID=A0AAV0BLC3_PHAPC|nr:hypothetical protein PPACK8108_LOCUS21626 [Phakopsora pachyrhizi]
MPAISFVLAHINTDKSNTGTNSVTAEHSRSSLLSAACSNSAYYHPNYPPSSPKANLVLTSSDSDSCWFAINCKNLFFRDDAFCSVGLEIVTPDSNLPLIKLGESCEVIKVILACLQPDTLPDFGNIDFRVLVSALEAAADKYCLVHIEKMCLLALGFVLFGFLYFFSPLEVYTLASHYSCQWLAEVASKYTLKVNITQPEYQDILTSENYDVLVSLHKSRINIAKLIVLSQTIAVESNSYKIEELKELWAEASEQIALRITRPSNNFQQLFAPELELALSRFTKCAKCYAALLAKFC